MIDLTPVTMVVNGLTLSLALGFLVIVLWYDSQREVNQFFAVFLSLVALWNVGIFFSQMSAWADDSLPLDRLATAFTQIGFSGASVALYALVTVLLGVHTRWFRALAFLSLFMAIGYQAFLWLLEARIPGVTTSLGTLQATSQQAVSSLPLSSAYYWLFSSVTLFILWRYHRKSRSRTLVVGIVAFVLGQGLGFLNPQLGVVTLSTSISAFGALLMSFAIVRRELIAPLTERGSQLQAMHEVSLAITSRIPTDAVLNEIAERVVALMEADAAGIFLRVDDGVELVAASNLPPLVLRTRLNLGEGLAGTVVAERESRFMANYARDWKGAPDLPMARETFGSVIGVPLIDDEAVIGALLVIAGTQGRLFDRAEVPLLEMLGAQAAVAIANGRAFSEQREVTDQLRAVLLSTESPVIALDRQMRLIFANLAAEAAFDLDVTSGRGRAIGDLLPASLLPPSLREVLSTLRESRVYIYEIAWRDKIYQCHLATLGERRVEGWVAVLHDVTQLMELDRIKSEMVRMTSHDLKNPLQAAFANLELLRDDLRDVAHEKQSQKEIELSLNNVEQQLVRMHRIISSILDLERIRLGPGEIQRCHPGELAQQVLAEHQHDATVRDVTLTADIADALPDFLGDSDQFARALSNLLDNALKFTNAGGEVHLSVAYDGACVRFVVADDGIGIPEAVQAKIFDRFYRGRQPGAEHVSGSGLGLSLVKSVVDNHRGKIWLASQPQAGTTFTIAIPVQDLTTPAPAS